MTAYRLLLLSLLLVHTVSLSDAFIPAFTLEDSKLYSIDERYRRRRRHHPAADTLFLAAQQVIPRPGDRPPPQGGDMAYIKRNIDRQFQYYNQMRQVGGVECVTDVYASSPKQAQVFWFAGKVARCTGVLLSIKLLDSEVFTLSL